MATSSNSTSLSLYPLKFRPIYKEKIWGGHRLHKLFGHTDGAQGVGESWLLSGLGNDQTVVTNGYLADNTITELVEVYMGELVGDKVYEQFGDSFPLLFKLIDADDDLSVQVHPDDRYALDNGLESGKTEMWYVLHSNDGQIVYGLDKQLSAPQLRQSLIDHSFMHHLHRERVSAGDCVLINSGTIHSLGKGVMVAEIQQSADVTFRLYDYGRRDSNGHERELHVNEALDVAVLEPARSVLIDYKKKDNGAANICQTPYFTVNTLCFSQPIGRDYATLDSFVAYLCVDGAAVIAAADTETDIRCGELVLMPASINDVVFKPQGNCQLLEVYIS